jgi:hypothetical protein
MDARAWKIGAIGAIAGAAVASVGWAMSRDTKPAKVTADRTDAGDPKSDDTSLVEANKNLVESLRACERKLADNADPGPNPTATVAQPEQPFDRRDGGRRRGGRGGEPSKEDWERMAQEGTMRLRVPCIRDKPWSPSQRVQDRLGLAPQDVEVIRQAYEASNKRVAEQVKPICASVLGSAEAAERVGTSSCIDSILSTARRGDSDGTKQAIGRVAEANAGKREAAKPGASTPAIEQLLTVLTKEPQTFEADLAKKVGPEEAKRLAWAPEMCADRRNFRAAEEER